jgi:hypothetical protein
MKKSSRPRVYGKLTYEEFAAEQAGVKVLVVLVRLGEILTKRVNRQTVCKR